VQAVANIVPLDRALSDLSEGRPLPSRAVAVTFDDGYRDNLTLAAPLLRRMRIPATCFLVPGILSGLVVPWWERLGWAFAKARATTAEWDGHRFTLGGTRQRHAVFNEVAEHLKRRGRTARDAAVDELCQILAPSGDFTTHENFLDWNGARELKNHMDIGSHTMFHAILSEESAEAQQQDLAESRRQLESELGDDIRLLAYPNGTRADYTADTVRAAERAGYTHAITTQTGWNTRSTPRYEIRRWVMRPEWGVVDLTKILRDGLRKLFPTRRGG
jgi:peptidoglycan/xylan/chitin deacetylase (PgdA/CDA1 family)